MIEWQDEGIVLAARRHGERDAILHLMTFAHGRHAGLVHGGGGRKAAPLLQPGNRVECVWQARLVDHLGHWRLEPIRLLAGALLDDPLRLTGLAAATGLIEAAMAERDPHPHLYAALLTLLERMAADDPSWPVLLVRLELVLLAETGFALDLESCAVTGAREDLAYVSPRTGRAVSTAAAGDLAQRLLPLPPFLAGDGAGDAALPPVDDLLAAFRLTGHFLGRHVMDPLNQPLPAARERLVDLLGRGRAGAPA